MFANVGMVELSLILLGFMFVILASGVWIAVAKPSTSEKNTARINSMQGMSFADSRSFSRNGIGGSRGGTLCGLSSDQPMM